MKFTVDGTQHEFDEERMTFGEGRAIEKVTGYAFGEVGEHGKELAVIQAFVWVALKRSEPTLQFSDLDDRNIGDFEFEQDDEDESDPTEGAEAEPQTADHSTVSA